MVYWGLAFIVFSVALGYVCKLTRHNVLANTIVISLVLTALYLRNESDAQNHKENQTIILRTEMMTLASNLQLILNNEAGLIRGLAVNMSENPDVNQEEFSRVASYLMEGQSQIVSMAAAPNMVVQFIHPYEENKMVIGLDYKKRLDQKKAAENSARSNNVLIAGPVKLVQGGEALIGRISVQSTDSLGNPYFWGIVSAPITIEGVYKRSHLADYTSKYDIVLQGKDAEGELGKVFYGDSTMLDSSGVIQTNISLPVGSWVLYGRHSKPVIYEMPKIWYGVLFFLSALSFIFFWRQSRYEFKMARAQEQLLESQDKAIKASKAKSSFLANMSHEVRTPMNGIQGSADLLRDLTTDPNMIEYIDLIKGSCDSLVTIINDVLDFSKIESGKLEFEYIPTNYKAIIQEIIVNFKNSAESNGNQFELRYPKEIPEGFLIDPTRMRQVLYNLISNANKFTKNGLITVAVETKELRPDEFFVMTTINDTGIGMSQEQLGRVFERFVQANESTTRLFGGTGLGTAICKQLIELMHGSIMVESVEGRGSTFRFQLPMKVAEIKNTKKVEATARNYGAKILLVEDNKINVKIATKTLHNFGVEVDVAVNGEMAIQMATAIEYDLVLMDIQMPVMGGVEATEKLKALNYNKPIVALSANAMREDIIKYQEIGMADVVPKPIDRRQLIEVLDRLLESPD